MTSISLDSLLQQAAVSAVARSFGAQVSTSDIAVQRTRKEFPGDRTLVVFPLTRWTKLSPEATAEALGQALLDALPELQSYHVVKGFLNLTMRPTYWLTALEKAWEDRRFGLESPGSRSQVMVEYSSPNTNKPLHLGHLRNNFLGYAVAQILEAVGHEVVKVQIINDRGIHICKSMWAWQHLGNGETPESSGLKGDKLVGKYYVAFDQQYKKEVAERVEKGMAEEDAKSEAPCLLAAQELLRRWEAGDDEVIALWQRMNAWVYAGFDVTYREMGVDFDRLYFESETYALGREEVQKGLASGVFFKKPDGSVWIDLTAEGWDEKLLLRKDGTTVYITQDIGTALQRYRDFPKLERQIYTVGNEQEYHFKVLFAILKHLGVPHAERNFHLSYGMVNLPEGRMKSREGTVVDADDLMAEMASTARSMAEERGKLEGLDEAQRENLFKQVGYGALKYFLLKVSPSKDMLFDPAASIDFIGNTGPFIQFNFVRIASVLRSAGVQWDSPVIATGNADGLDAMELDLIQLCLEYPNIIQSAAEAYDPSLIANYAYELSKGFSSWYQDHSILQEPNSQLRALRLQIALLCGRNIQSSMGLLGIEMPDRM
jgi:arginyl-tRNA synthetase